MDARGVLPVLVTGHGLLTRWEEVVRGSPDEERLALRAASGLGTPVAGVDLLPGPGGKWYVLEVNAVPGWRALAPVTGGDVAALVQCLAEEHGAK